MPLRRGQDNSVTQYRLLQGAHEKQARGEQRREPESEVDKAIQLLVGLPCGGRTKRPASLSWGPWLIGFSPVLGGARAAPSRARRSSDLRT